MTIGERIRALRDQLGISQVDFANKINVSKQTLYKYENNLITNIPSDKIEAVAKIANVSPAYLMGWESDAHKTAYQLSELIHNDLYREVFDRLTKMSDKTIRRYIKYGDFLIEEQEDDN